MAKQRQRLKQALSNAKEAAEQVEEKDEKERRKFDSSLMLMLSGLLSLVAIAAALLIAPTITLAGLVTGHPRLAFALLVVFGVLIYISDSANRTFSFPFVFITAGVGLTVWTLLPSSVTAGFTLEPLIGIEVPMVSGPALLVGAVAVSAVYWTVEMYVTLKNTPRPATVVDKLIKRYAKIIDIYTAMLGALGLGLVYVGFVVLQNGAEVLGQLGDVLALEPFLASNLWAIATGWLAMGGEVPVVGSLPFMSGIGAVGFAFISSIVLVIAVMAHYDATGPTSRLFR